MFIVGYLHSLTLTTDIVFLYFLSYYFLFFNFLFSNLMQVSVQFSYILLKLVCHVTNDPLYYIILYLYFIFCKMYFDALKSHWVLFCMPVNEDMTFPLYAE